MGVIRQLKNFFTGKIIYPKTLTKAVYDENGERLDKILRDTMLAVDNEEYDGVEPRDADTLGGKYTAKNISAIEDKLTDLNSSLSAIDNILNNIGHIEYGRAFASGTYVEVIFEKSFSEPPVVIATGCAQGSNRGVTVENITTTGCKLYFWNGASAISDSTACWFAIGK